MPTRHDHRLHVVQIEARMLHVDKGGVEPSEADNLDNLRVGNAADMGAQGEATLAQDALYPILSHGALRSGADDEARRPAPAALAEDAR